MSKGAKQGVFIGLAAIVIVAVIYAFASGRTASTLPAGQSGAQSAQGSEDQVDQATLQRIQDLEKSIKSGQKNVPILTELGLLYFDAGQLDKSAESFAAAIEIEPNDADLHVYLGLTYFWTGRSKEAMAEYQKAMKADPKAPDSYFQMALAQSHSQPSDIPAAIQNWKKVIELSPDSPIAKKSQEYIDKNQNATAQSGSAPPLGQSKP